MTVDTKQSRGKPIYFSVQPGIGEALEVEAGLRGRSVSSLVYVLLMHCTKGFTDFSLADRPIVLPVADGAVDGSEAPSDS